MKRCCRCVDLRWPRHPNGMVSGMTVSLAAAICEIDSLQVVVHSVLYMVKQAFFSSIPYHQIQLNTHNVKHNAPQSKADPLYRKTQIAKAFCFARCSTLGSVLGDMNPRGNTSEQNERILVQGARGRHASSSHRQATEVREMDYGMIFLLQAACQNCRSFLSPIISIIGNTISKLPLSLLEPTFPSLLPFAWSSRLQPEGTAQVRLPYPMCQAQLQNRTILVETPINRG